MIEIKPEDIEITWKLVNWDTTATLIHLPTKTELKWKDCGSGFRDASEVEAYLKKVLQDILTPFEEGDVIVTQYGEGKVTKVYYPFNDLSFVVDDGTGRFKNLDKVAHTKEGYIYKNTKRLQDELTTLEEGYYNDRDILLEEIKTLEGMV